MTDVEYRAALETIGISQQGFARLVGASPRTGQKWALGEARVPGSVALLLKLLLARPELMTVLSELGSPPVRTRKTSEKGSGSGVSSRHLGRKH
jgi:transcriptional regulator with XRE-family HTH domain